MKKTFLQHFFFVFTLLLLNACSTKYYFCQLLQTTPAENKEQFTEKDGFLTYENDQCTISYNFWSEGGNTSFVIYNKTDNIITIDLGQSFFTMNGFAYDLFLNSSFHQGYSLGTGTSISSNSSFISYASKTFASTMGSHISAGSAIFSNNNISATGRSVASTSSYQNTYSNLFLHGFSASNSMFQSKSTEQTIVEKQLVSIPPHFAKEISSYRIIDSPLLMCELESYPSTSSVQLSFNKYTSPITFSLLLTYQVNNKTGWETLENQFYVSKMANYAEPSICEFIERTDPCENLKNPNYKTSTYKLYDKYLKSNLCTPSSSFYFWYDVESKKILYDEGPFQYVDAYKAYIFLHAPTLGSYAPELDLPNPNGKMLKLSDLRGKVVLVYFWTPKDGLCHDENVNVRRIYSLYHDKGLEVYSVCLDNDTDALRNAIVSEQLEWANQVSDTKGLPSATIYGVESIPTIFLLDKEGRIIAKNPKGDGLERSVKYLLDKKY